MTHEELLAKVNKDIEDDEWYDKTAVFNFHIYAKALRAVVELHRPSDDPLSVTTFCLQCRDEQWPAEYPCSTIQAIEKELT